MAAHGDNTKIRGGAPPLIFVFLDQEIFLYPKNPPVFHPCTVGIYHVSIGGGCVGKYIAIGIKIITFCHAVAVSVNPVPAVCEGAKFF